MLCFDLDALASGAARVDDTLATDDGVWTDGDPVPAEPLRVRGRLSGAGAHRFYFSGHVAGESAGECRRCLAAVRSKVDEEAHFVFAELGDDEADDPDVFRYDPRGRVLDLRPAVREHWLLTAPAWVLCRDDCKGLCAKCGANLNHGPCGCAPEIDQRWSALRSAGDAGR